MNIFSRLIKNVRNFFAPKKPSKSNTKPKSTNIPKNTFSDIKQENIKVETIELPDIKDNSKQEAYFRIDEIKRQFQESIIDKANLRWKHLEELGLSSSAVYRALEDNNDVPYFNISQLNNYNDIISEVTRARVFLNDYNSSVEGARLFTQEEKSMEWRAKFGNNYNNWVYHYKNFDIYNINEDYAKVAFRLYRDMEGSIANWMQRYGSGESIALIYEMVQDMDIVDKDNNDELDEARKRIEDFFEEKYGVRGRVSERTFDIENQETNYIYNKIKYQNKDMEQFDMDKTYF